MAKKPNINIKEDLRFNISRANEIVRLAEERRYKFLEINLALVTAFSFLLVYIMDIFNAGGKLSMIISFVIYFGFSSANFIYNLRENRTKGISKSICGVRGWKHHNFRKIMINIDEYSFEDDYKIQLVNLHKYQKNYNKIGITTRLLTLMGLLILLITFVISVIINTLGYSILNWLIILIIFLWNIIPSIIIFGILIIIRVKEKKR